MLPRGRDLFRGDRVSDALRLDLELYDVLYTLATSFMTGRTTKLQTFEIRTKPGLASLKF